MQIFGERRVNNVILLYFPAHTALAAPQAWPALCGAAPLIKKLLCNL